MKQPAAHVHIIVLDVKRELFFNYIPVLSRKNNILMVFGYIQQKKLALKQYKADIKRRKEIEMQVVNMN